MTPLTISHIPSLDYFKITFHTLTDSELLRLKKSMRLLCHQTSQSKIKICSAIYILCPALCPTENWGEWRAVIALHSWLASTWLPFFVTRVTLETYIFVCDACEKVIKIRDIQTYRLLKCKVLRLRARTNINLQFREPVDTVLFRIQYYAIVSQSSASFYSLFQWMYLCIFYSFIPFTCLKLSWINDFERISAPKFCKLWRVKVNFYPILTSFSASGPVE